MQNRPKDLPNAVEETILRRIETGEYSPGSRLPTEADLAAELGVSRATLREGLRHLIRFGVISTVRGAHGGMFVRQPDSSMVMETMTLLLRLKSVTLDSLMEARRALAPPIAALAAHNATPEDIEKLEELCEVLGDGLNTGDFKLEALLAFHNHLVVMTRNNLLVALVQPLNEIAASFLRRFWRISLNTEVMTTLSGHHRLIETLRKGDGETAYAAMSSLMTAGPEQDKA